MSNQLLLVEDEAILAMTEKRLLEKYGYIVHHVNTGEKALQTIIDNTKQVDLILMDINLGSGIDGTKAAELILNHKDVPVVFLSSHTDPEVVEKTEKITSYGYVVKNSSITVLDASIKMAMKLFSEKVTRKLAEDKLYIQSLVLDQIQECVRVTNLDGIITYVNEAEARVLGFSQDELIGFSTEKFGDTSQIGATQQLILKETLEHGSFRGEIVHYSGTGEQIVQDLRTQVIVNEEGNKIALVGVSSDITERKRIEEALITKIHLLERIFQNSTDLITLADLDGNYTMLSEANRILHDDLEKLIGKHALELVHPEDLSYVSSAFADFLKTPDQNSPRVTYRHRSSDGNYLWLETTGTFLKDAHGNLEQILFNTRDITDHKKAEEEIQRQLAEKEIFLKEVHHRIKNNMAGVESLLSLQADSADNTEVKLALHQAVSRIRSIRGLYDKLLIGNAYERVSMKDYLENLIDSVAEVFNDHPGVTLEKKIVDLSLHPKVAVPIGIILNELLTNVFKYAFTGHKSGHILVELISFETSVTLTISDDGIGIDESLAANKSPKFGLTIVKMLAEQLEGTFTMKNDHGTKSVFEFELKG